MQEQLKKLTNLILWMNQRGWSPATSTNYSHRDLSNSKQCYVSRSGIDKASFQESDFILMNLDGNIDPAYQDIKPSAETGIHLMLYTQTDCNVVLHTHSKPDTLLSRLFAKKKQLTLSDYELLKGLRDITTHAASIDVPIFENDQDIESLSEQMAAYLKENANTQGLLIESHGFYTWGRSLEEAKRHIEVFQFLFDCELSLLLANN